MTSPTSTNVAYLQTALRNLEDRYKKLQNRTDSLQTENERLLASRTELVLEVERLQDQQIRLRERNLRLTQEFHSKQQECSLLAEKLTMFARGRVGCPKGGPDSNKSDLTDVKEDLESSHDSSLVTVELQGGAPSRPKVLYATSRTLSEPNLTVIQRELDLVRKGLWSPALEPGPNNTVEEISSKLIDNLKKGQGQLEEQFSRMMQIQRNSLEAVQELSNVTDSPGNISFAGEKEPMEYVQGCTRTAMALQGKLQNQNQKLRQLYQFLKLQQAAPSEPVAASVVTQTSFDRHTPSDLNCSSVWKNMQTDRICPLCENIFSTVISQDEFVDHVMSHFSGDESVLPEFEILTS